MNYFNPNFYQNYPYAGSAQYQPTYNQVQSTTQPQPQMQMPTQQLPQLGLNGKIVDTVDMVKVTEVPIGGYGIFPKADLNEIYVKTWNNNGTTSIITFRPIVQEAKEPQTIEDNSLKIIERLNALDAKIDSLMMNKTATAAPVTKKEVRASDY